MSDTRPSAPGAPGIAPTWSSSAKDAVGTSVVASRVWFTVGRGILDEVYWPRVDRPQIRDLGFILADGAGFWSEVKRDAVHEVRYPTPDVPAITVTHRHAQYVLTLRICVDDHADVVRIEAELTDRREGTAITRQGTPLRLYALVAPHLGSTGLGNRAWVGTYKGRRMLFARRRDSVLALAAEPPPTRFSVGYVGTSDGWQDFAAHGRMTWEHGATAEGNVAGMLELDLLDGRSELALGFGTRFEQAALQVSATLAEHFRNDWAGYVEAWTEWGRTITRPPSVLDEAERQLYLISAAVLRTHEDATAPGATVASLSVPWGATTDAPGGYHLVWSRDLVETAGAFVALGSGPRPSGRWRTWWRPRSPTATGRRTNGWTAGRTGAASSSTRLPTRSCWWTRCGVSSPRGRTRCATRRPRGSTRPRRSTRPRGSTTS